MLNRGRVRWSFFVQIGVGQCSRLLLADVWQGTFSASFVVIRIAKTQIVLVQLPQLMIAVLVSAVLVEQHITVVELEQQIGSVRARRRRCILVLVELVQRLSAVFNRVHRFIWLLLIHLKFFHCTNLG